MPTRQQFDAAKQTLIKKGYEHIASVMSDGCNDDGHFGSMFSKEGCEVFYLNYLTIGNVESL